MHYYNHNIDEFRSLTINMSREARWIFRDMLDIIYRTEKPLADDLAVICRQLGVRSEEEKAIVAEILLYEFVQVEGGYMHPRAAEQIAAYHAKADKARVNGKKGGRPLQHSDDYMPTEGTLYAVRVNDRLVKVGVSANMKSRLNQLRNKYGKDAYLLHHVQVSHMGNAEWDLLCNYEHVRNGEELVVTTDDEPALVALMGRIKAKYEVASWSHTDSSKSHTESKANQELRTKNQEPKTKEKSKDKASPAGDAVLFPDVDPQVVADFKALRAKKRAAITATAMRDIATQAGLAGMTLEAALRVCCSRGWAGFEAEWVQPKTASTSPKAPYQTATDKARAWADNLIGRNRDDRADIIDINPAPLLG